MSSEGHRSGFRTADVGFNPDRFAETVLGPVGLVLSMAADNELEFELLTFAWGTELVLADVFSEVDSDWFCDLIDNGFFTSMRILGL